MDNNAQAFAQGRGAKMGHRSAQFGSMPADFMTFAHLMNSAAT